MLKYITDEEYVELLGSESIPDNFENLVIKASNYINYQTHGRIDKNNIPKQVKYVTCLIIDLICRHITHTMLVHIHYILPDQHSSLLPKYSR